MELQEEEKISNQLYTTKMKYIIQQGVSQETQYILDSPWGASRETIETNHRHCN
jgi:hypothetical protein